MPYCELIWHNFSNDLNIKHHNINQIQMDAAEEPLVLFLHEYLLKGDVFTEDVIETWIK